MLNLPVYLRNSSYYFHTRIHGKQFKRSLHTADRQIAIIRACKLLEGIQMSIDLNNIKKYELDLSRGIARSDGPEDHQRLLETLALMRENQSQKQQPILKESSLPFISPFTVKFLHSIFTCVSFKLFALAIFRTERINRRIKKLPYHLIRQSCYFELVY